ncbi:hypothetical protein RCL_jg25683.t1 [Rhizophagus clarus]|uniref:Uncharacterized protein n=1 Tax=Rhizophagus clarus TaxID=94130 RepID=A0A8H3KV66_9GLOM|nr:hypothetical protein RCL_jg25683.t1 [Rhizophagus clarus]
MIFKTKSAFFLNSENLLLTNVSIPQKGHNNYKTRDHFQHEKRLDVFSPCINSYCISLISFSSPSKRHFFGVKKDFDFAIFL